MQKKLETPDAVSYMGMALRLARRAWGRTSPNPMVGAMVVKNGAIIGRGWHRRAGGPHAEIEAICDAQTDGHDLRGATLFVTLEPCSTHGRTPPCTDAIIAAGIGQVVVGATDPNPKHAGRGFAILQRAGISVTHGVLGAECAALNETFNHWIVHGTPLVTVKAAMSLDGKIATASGESKWITGEHARVFGMKLRARADAVLVGVNTIIKDDPSLTVRLPGFTDKPFHRIVLDPSGRTPPTARVLCDEKASMTTIVVTKSAQTHRLVGIRRRARVLVAPARGGRIDLSWLSKTLGGEKITSLLVEGGGETNAGWVAHCQRIAFFYAPIIFGGRSAPTAVAGLGVQKLKDKLALEDVLWRKLGCDLLLTAKVRGSK